MVEPVLPVLVLPRCEHSKQHQHEQREINNRNEERSKSPRRALDESSAGLPDTYKSTSKSLERLALVDESNAIQGVRGKNKWNE